MECISTSFLQRRPGRLHIYKLEKHSRLAVEDTYLGYMTKMAQQTHEGLT
jgi:hypothetical protein